MGMGEGDNKQEQSRSSSKALGLAFYAMEPFRTLSVVHKLKHRQTYAATKGAIMIFTKGLAKQLAGKGIRVNAVAPGPVWTALQVTGGQPTDKLPEFGKNTPMGRPGQPAELAALYVLLASPEASYSTGQVFAAVGGRGGP
jgi:NAD(P)-dependent dehydrogenase (short-subunit alcohol dehydrogenase family)